MKLQRFFLLATLLILTLPGHRALAQTTIPWWLWDFKFAPGSDLIGKTEINGAVWTAAGPVGPHVMIASNSLPVPGLPLAEGNCARLAGVDGPAARIGLGTNVTSGTVYYSLALRVTDLGTLGTNGGTLAALNNATGTSSNLPAPLAARLCIRSSGTGYQLGLSAASANTAVVWWQADWPWFHSNDTAFVVCSYTFNTGPSNDLARLWVNPNPATFGASNSPPPDLTATSASDLNQISSFVLMQRPQPILPAATLVDEVRVGPTWASVTPIDPRPTITQQPQSLTVTQGQTANFSVAATGASPLSYQWRREGNGWITSASTYTGLTIPNASQTDAGGYSVTVSNSYGSVTSSVATLTVMPPPVVVFDGLEHSTLGGASLSVSSNGLSLANRSSTNDGVRISLGQAEGWRADISSSLTNPTNDYIPLFVTSRGSAGGQSNQLLSSLSIKRSGSNMMFSPDFSGLGSSQYVAKIYDQNGTLLYSRTATTGQYFPISLPCMTDEGEIGHWVCYWDTTGASYGHRVCECIGLTDISSNIPGPVVIEFSAVSPAVSVEYLNTIEISGQNSSTLTLSNEALLQGGFWHKTIGQTHFSARPTELGQELLLSNLATNGEDGISTEMSKQATLEIAAKNPCDPWYSGCITNPVHMTLRMHGTANGLETELCSMSLDRQGQVMNLSGSFAVNQFLLELEIWNGSQLVGSATMPPGTLATLGQEGGLIIENPWDDWWFFTSDQGQPAVAFHQAAPDKITVSNSQFVGDKVVCKMISTSQTTYSLTRIDQFYAGAGSLGLLMVQRDYGDAPNVYKTLRASGGASHVILPGWRLGTAIDAEPDGLPGADANGDDLSGTDDEDSVTFSAITPGSTASVTITGKVPPGKTGYLNAWMDFDHNGSWADADDHIITDYAIAGAGASFSVTLSFPVPSYATPGLSYARFRLSKAAGISSFGPVVGGEIEDYGFECQSLDFGDAPDCYRTTSGVDGARHIMSPQFCLGAMEDIEKDGFPSPTATGDDLDMPFGFDDEDGLSAASSLVPGDWGTFDIMATVPFGTTAYLNAWVDWNKDGDFDDTDEQIATGLLVGNGLNTVGFTVPTWAVVDTTYLRLRLSTVAALPSYGLAPDGEVEDHLITIVPFNPSDLFEGLDYTTFGGAGASVTTNGLNVYNLTSTNSGVRINLGQAEGWRADLSASFADDFPITFASKGTVGGQSNQVLNSLRVQRSGSNFVFYPDFSGVGASQYTVNFYRNGALLACKGPFPIGRGVPGKFCITDDGDYGELSCGYEVDAWNQKNWVCHCVKFQDLPEDDIPAPTEVTFSAVAPTAIGPISTIEIRGQIPSNLTLRNEALLQGGLWHKAIGQTRLSAVPTDSGQELQISNLATNGENGISTELGPEAICCIGMGKPLYDWAKNPCDPWYSGCVTNPAHMTLRMHGTANGLETELCSMTLDRQGQGMNLSGNFAVNQFLLELEIWNGSQLVGSATLPPGRLATLGLEGGSFYDWDWWLFTSDQGQPTVAFHRAAPAQITAGSSQFAGDKVVCKLVSASQTTYSLTKVDHTWTGVPDLGLLILQRDFGDAPAGYPVTLAEGGAWHSYAPGWRFGATRDAELDGTHSPHADYDDTHGLAANDEDGVTVITALGGIRVKVVAAVNGFLDGWVDLNRNHSWDPIEKVANAVPLVAGVPTYVDITVPDCTPAGAFYSRWRLSATGGLLPTGAGGKGEVVDLEINWQPENHVELDFGDAPEAGTGFEVTLGRDGARHFASALKIGALWDSEPDGQPSPNADGDDVNGIDDEGEGIFFPNPLIPGALVHVLVTVNGGNGILDAWLDFNHNLNWDPAEHAIAGVAVVPGANDITFVVPPGAIIGPTYVRFRLSTTGSPTPRGCAPDGEVNDLYITVGPNGDDNQFAIGPSLSPIGLTENIARDFTLSVTNKGSSTASNLQLLVNLPAGLRVDAATNSAGTAQMTSSNVTCSVPSLAGNGIFTVKLTLRANFLAQDSPVTVSLANLEALLNLAPNQTLQVPVSVTAQTDWGDARGGFPVTAAENGAYHRYSPTAPWLGLRWDNDGNGNHSPNADFDDTHPNPATSDEDGIIFERLPVAGQIATVKVICTHAAGRLDAWADFNSNTNWSDPGEQIFASQPLSLGTNVLTFPVPANAVPGLITTRWRVSTTGGLSFTGYGGYGEIEDTMIRVQALPKPSLGRLNNGLGVSFQTETNASYRVEFTDSLATPNWTLLMQVTGTGQTVSVADNPNGPSRFYRVVPAQ